MSTKIVVAVAATLALAVAVGGALASTGEHRRVRPEHSESYAIPEHPIPYSQLDAYLKTSASAPTHTKAKAESAVSKG